ncbi:hypothetical protein L9F63_023485, partial [Diploptera punctata]
MKEELKEENHSDIVNNIVVISDSEEEEEEDEIKPKKFGSRKRKLDSDSDDDYLPETPKKKIKKAEGKPKPEKKPKEKAAPKEKKPKTVKPKTERKKPVRKTKTKENVLQGSAGEGTSNVQLGNPIQIQDADRMEWNESEYVAQLQQVEVHIARNIIRLLDEDNTIPFIARYRKELTNDMSPEKLREVKAAYDMVKSVKQKAASVMKSIANLGKLTPYLERSIRCARTINELDHIYTPFKPGSKRTLAERARQLGLDDPANYILCGIKFVVLEQLLKPQTKGLDNLNDIELGLQHIIADVISKDRNVLDYLTRLKNNKSKSKKEKEGKKDGKKAEHAHKDKVDNESKFENYFKFSIPIKYIKPYQVLAVNRGENLKVLSVKLNVPDWVLHRLRDFCQRQWLSRGIHFPLRSRLVNSSIQDAYTRLIQPFLIRQIRSELTQKAEHAAIEVFATNLKKLLLSPPFRGKVVLGIDPGFRNGCKIGVSSPTGTVLCTDVIYPQFGKQIYPQSDSNALKLKDLLNRYNCEVIALGNGTACRETETYLNVKYTIVSEQGASIYSCSPIAQKEFPGVDPNNRVSLARRLQDPLGELVKVEPKHLGVGMYQHDVPEKQLSSSLDEIVTECVSFVGVDINIASDCLLRRVAGLNSARAEKLIEWRRTNGPFTNRQQLKKVKGIGAKTFEQCAGFVRVIPETAKTKSMSKPSGSSKSKKSKLTDESENPLDRTWIHPESYTVALRFIEKCDVSLEDLGTPQFIRKVENAVTRI